MCQNDIITKVHIPTPWVSSITYARKKSGAIRICLDPKDLNKAIRRPHYTSRTLDEVNHLLCKAKVFSKLDARSGYWAVMLDDASSHLTTFNTHQGRYRFKRLPFGLNLSQDVFQEHMDYMLQPLVGIINIADDIIVYGKDIVSHDNNLLSLMKRAEEYGLVFNIDKCDIGVPEISFFGLIYSEKGIRPDPERTSAIRNIPTPTSLTSTRSFLGVANYMAPFVPHISDLLSPIRELTKKDVVFCWTPSHQQIFETIKEKISKNTTLKYFDTSLHTTIQVDASGIGLGAVLLQNNTPICFASRTLTDTEKRYANIDRELLAVVYGCERFHHYVFGKIFTIESDHRPLEMITLKNTSSAPARLQRLLLRIQNYQATIKYKPGKEMILADAFSRSPEHQHQNDITININLICFTPKTEAIITLAQSEDLEHKELKEILASGWPQDRRHVNKYLRQYWPYRDELTYDDTYIMKGNAVLVPSRARDYIIKRLHEAHQGLAKMLITAKDNVFWPAMRQDLTNITTQCKKCQTFAKSQWKPPHTPRELPTRPWQYIATDLFQLDGKTYLLTVDIFSKYPILHQLRNGSTSKIVINRLSEAFSMFGIPERLYSDNGPQYSSPEFAKFASSWGFQHVTSSPHYPQSNGFIERHVQTIKTIIQKAESLPKALLSWRNTPIDIETPSPLYTLTHQNQDTIQKIIHQQQLKSDAQALRLSVGRKIIEAPELQPNQTITTRISTSDKWEPAIVIRKRSEPNSYDIKTKRGIVRRARHQIRTIEPMHIPSYSSHQHIPLPPASHNNINTPDITVVTNVDPPPLSTPLSTQHQNTPYIRTSPQHPTPPDTAINTRSLVTTSRTSTNIAYLPPPSPTITPNCPIDNPPLHQTDAVIPRRSSRQRRSPDWYIP